jgi:hypothetical protein
MRAAAAAAVMFVCYLVRGCVITIAGAEA